MIRRRWLYVVALTTVAGLAAGSFALANKLDGPPGVPNTKNFHATLYGYQEVPTNSTTGYGEFRAKLVNDTTLHYVLTYAGLEGTVTTQAHVHFGARSTAGGVSFFLCGGTKPPCTPTAGEFEGDITAADVVGPAAQGIDPTSFAEIIRAMRGGVAYANIHTTPRWPAGEIRGQINDDDGKGNDNNGGHGDDDD
jgi:CHRD domain